MKLSLPAFLRPKSKPAPEMTLEEWLKKENLEPCDFPLVIQESRTYKLVYEPAIMDFSANGPVVIQHAIVTSASGEERFDYDSMQGHLILASKYRIHKLGEKYVLLYERNRYPEKYFFYIRETS